MMKRDYHVLCLQVGPNQFEPLAYSDQRLSLGEVKKLVKRFRHDADVISASSTPWNRLYSSVTEMKHEIKPI